MNVLRRRRNDRSQGRDDWQFDARGKVEVYRAKLNVSCEFEDQQRTKN
jgi:hypothetical protein